MHRTAEFHGPIDGGIVIPAPHAGSGGSMNFYFGGHDTGNGIVKGNPMVRSSIVEMRLEIPGGEAVFLRSCYVRAGQLRNERVPVFGQREVIQCSQS